MNDPKEVDVFRKYSGNNKLKVIGLSLLIAIVSFLALYFFCKAILTYTVTYNLNGGYVYNVELQDPESRFVKELEPVKLGFLGKITEPAGVKKEGYYIEYWSAKEDLSSKFTFGTRIWRSTKLYVKWAEGVAVRLHFAEGEENEDMSTNDLKGMYEWYVKAGTEYTLPQVYNHKVNSVHYGEHLLWFTNPECTGEPFSERTYTLNENIDLYGKWFDTSADKFSVDENGTLQKYLGRCNKIILPSGITKIKDIDVTKFTTGESDSLGDQTGTYHSVWQNVMSDSTGINGLKIIYLNAELTTIGDCAFRDCRALEKIIFTGDNVESIGAFAFANCSKLSEFTFPSHVTTIKSNTFDGTFDYKKNVSLHLQNVVTIEDKAFINCNLKSIEMDKVSYIGANGFTSCHHLTDFKINNATQVITSSVSIGDIWDTTREMYIPNPVGIFFDTYTKDANANKLKIYIPDTLKSAYLNAPWWACYSEFGFVNK